MSADEQARLSQMITSRMSERPRENWMLVYDQGVRTDELMSVAVLVTVRGFLSAIDALPNGAVPTEKTVAIYAHGLLRGSNIIAKVVEKLDDAETAAKKDGDYAVVLKKKGHSVRLQAVHADGANGVFVGADCAVVDNVAEMAGEVHGAVSVVSDLLLSFLVVNDKKSAKMAALLCPYEFQRVCWRAKGDSVWHGETASEGVLPQRAAVFPSPLA